MVPLEFGTNPMWLDAPSSSFRHPENLKLSRFDGGLPRLFIVERVCRSIQFHLVTRQVDLEVIGIEHLNPRAIIELLVEYC